MTYNKYQVNIKLQKGKKTFVKKYISVKNKTINKVRRPLSINSEIIITSGKYKNQKTTVKKFLNCNRILVDLKTLTTSKKDKHISIDRSNLRLLC